MPTVLNGILSAENKSFAIIASRFNEFISTKLLDGALDCISRHKGDTGEVTVVWVPGAFETPMVAKKLAESKNYDAIIALGAIIRGATPHFDYIAAEASKGIASVSLETDVPVIFGILTTDTIEQAIERAGTKSGNKGWDAALTAIEMADLYTKINRE
jgi:6,7-dimethyl-8-ribityllumazine synthase